MKNIKIISIVLTAVLFASCQSTKVQSESTETDSYTTESENPVLKKKNNRPLISIGNISDFYTADEISVFTKTALGSIKSQRGNVYINLKKDTVGFGSPYMAAYYYVFLDEANRNKLSEAFETYQDDFAQKKLDRSLKNTYKKYGKITANLNWGTIQAITPSFGSGDAYIGYEFYEKSPYFSITIFPVFNAQSESIETVEKESLQLKYYFTKAQLQNLLELMDEMQEALNESKNDKIELPVEGDEY